jgi:hypothetical protein
VGLRRNRGVAKSGIFVIPKKWSGGVHFLARTGLLLDEQLTLVPESMPRPRLVDMDMHADGLPNIVAEPDPPF